MRPCASSVGPRLRASAQRRLPCPTQRARPAIRTLKRPIVCSARRSGSEAWRAAGDHPVVRKAIVRLGAFAAAFALFSIPAPTEATDAALVGSCLLQNCQKQLAGCLSDVKCLQNLACLQQCNGKPDEQACQIRCGDLYEDEAVTTFNCCAVSDKKCVPQAVTEDAYPVPRDAVLDSSFDLSNFQGRWYITAGYNKLFDTFDCQEHYFSSPRDEPNKVFGKIQWRIGKPDGDFIERDTVQRFVQDPQNPAKLYNHDNQYLHYEDDWYIVKSVPDEYVFIYYKGNNDAWRGYGGATVYTRAAELPQQYVPELEKAAQAVGLKWEDFTVTDNTCKPHPSRPGFNLFRPFEILEETLGKEIEKDLISFGRGFTVLESAIEKEITAEGRLIERELREAGKRLDRMEKRYEKTPPPPANNAPAVATIGQ